MNRPLQVLNLLGVAVLAAVCVLQWKRDRGQNLDLNRGEKVQLEQKAKLAEQEKHIQGLTDDLALFKEQLSRTQTDGGDARKRLRDLEREQLQLVAARDQLQESVTNWANAVSARDQLIAQANENIRALNERSRALAEQLNTSILKFNELATNYNAVVAELNAIRRAPGEVATNPATR